MWYIAIKFLKRRRWRNYGNSRFGFRNLGVCVLVVSVLGIVLSAVSRKKNVNGLSTAGLVIGILATVFSTIMTFTVGVAMVM